MPLFITPITGADHRPTTLPTPPEADAPPMKQAAITSSSKPGPALGVAVLSRAAKIEPGQRRQQPHIGESVEGQAMGLDARQPRRLLVAAERVDPPADNHAGGDEGVERDQRGHDDQHVRQALVRRHQVGERAGARRHQDVGRGRTRTAPPPAHAPARARRSLTLKCDQRQCQRAPIRNDVGLNACHAGGSSGIKPDRQRWNGAGNGPTDWPCRRASARPLNTSMPARVTMKQGIFQKATK